MVAVELFTKVMIAQHTDGIKYENVNVLNVCFFVLCSEFYRNFRGQNFYFYLDHCI